MSVPKIEFDSDIIDDQLDTGLDDMIDEKSCLSQGEEFMLTGNDDNLVAYRIVSMRDVADTQKSNNSLHSSMSSVSNVVGTSNSQQLQYFVIDNSNGFIQAVPATQITTISNNTTALKSMEQIQSTNNVNVNALKMRTSVAIAPKIETISPYNSSSCSTNNLKSTNTAATDALNSLKKNYDKRRATHNEVERRRRDKINHWIMKLGSIIPADGSSCEIGDSGRLSIAAIDGQSKGGILSKACEYVQMLQEKQTKSIENASLSDESRDALERKKYEDEIARLRGENELLKAILIKHGINYVKERTTFKTNEYS